MEDSESHVDELGIRFDDGSNVAGISAKFERDGTGNHFFEPARLRYAFLDGYELVFRVWPAPLISRQGCCELYKRFRLQDSLEGGDKRRAGETG